MKKETRGRKPIAPQNKKIQVAVYLTPQQIADNGGIEKVKAKFLETIK